MNEKLRTTLEKNRQEQIDLLMNLIGFPTVKGGEAKGQMYFADRLNELGAEVDIWEPDMEEMRKLPDFYTDRESYSKSPVVCGKIKGTGGGRSLILSGHMDVVPAKPKEWSTDPYKAVLKDERIYGRGAADMKGGISCSYIAMKSILDAGIKLKGDVLIQTTIDEEVGNTGAMALCQKYTADAAIVTEPTGLELNVATNGSRMFQVIVPGKAAHVGLAYNGENSIYKAIKIVEAIRELEERRRVRMMDPLYSDKPIPFCTNVTMFEAGVFRSIIPAETILTGRLGIAPSETVDEAVAELEEAIFAAAATDPWLKEHPPVITYFPSLWQSGYIDPEHPLTQLLEKNSKDRMGKKAVIRGMAACSDSGTYIKVGNIPAVNFGPNSMDMAHQNDEYVDLDSLFKCTDIIAQTIVDWCGTEEACVETRENRR